MSHEVELVELRDALVRMIEELTITVRALGAARVSVRRAARLGCRAYRDHRWGTALEARRRVLRVLGPSALFERGRISGLALETEPHDDRVELLARVEIVRDLLGPLDAIEALGPHPVEQP